MSLLALVPVSAGAASDSKILHAAYGKIPGQYLVVLTDDVLPAQVPQVARDLTAGGDIEVGDFWQYTVKGFFAKMTEARAESLSHNPRVKYVEENAVVALSGMHTNIDPATCDPVANPNCATVSDDRLWHLDRLDQNTIDPDNSYGYCAASDGTGVTVYVVDTGVNKFHQEFGGLRVTPGVNVSGDAWPADSPCNGFAAPPETIFDDADRAAYNLERDAAGHGTGVASLVGGRRVGVAKGVTIVPVKTARCDWYHARARKSSHQYAVNDTIFVIRGGLRYATYRAKTVSGLTASDQGLDSKWTSGAGATVTDGDVVWEFIPFAPQSVDMIISGLNWILSPENTGPKANAVVSMSTYQLPSTDKVAGGTGTLEGNVRRLLESGLTVIASANNQNGNACDTSPSRMSIEDTTNTVITVGGTMPWNRPWSTPIDAGETEADGGPNWQQVEPTYNTAKGVGERRWICGPGDSAPCSNSPSLNTVAPGSGGYTEFTGGSNGGPCVTLFAPAKNVSVASVGSLNDYRDPRLQVTRSSGTSWSAPIVAGLAARILQAHPLYSPAQVKAELLLRATVMDATNLDPLDANGNPITGTPNPDYSRCLLRTTVQA